jgi:kynurenine 3-monooxygenase
MRRRIIVVGAGLIGSVLSIFLARRGYRVDVFEQQPDLSRTRLRSGRSINLTLCERGIKVLDSIGVGGAVRRASVPAYGRLVHDVKGHLTYQPYGNNNEAIYSIARNELNGILLDYARRNFDVNFHFNSKCVGMDLANGVIEMRNTETGRSGCEAAERIFGSDGAYSAVRLHMQKTRRFNYSQYHWEQEYKELMVYPAAGDGWTAEKNALHIWPRGSYMLIGFPNLDGSFTCSLHVACEGEPSLQSLRTAEDLLALFDRSFPDVVGLIPNLADCFFANPANAMVTIKCSPWSYQGKVALVGDAAHAIFPSYGQGANAGFEDCAVLDDCMDEYGEDWEMIFREYEGRRKPNTDAIADLCVAHFIELRDLVGEGRFQLRKRIERKLNEKYPAKYKDLYSMITFTELGYAEAIRLDREQRAIVERILGVDGIEEKLNSPEVESLIDELMLTR